MVSTGGYDREFVKSEASMTPDEISAQTVCVNRRPGNSDDGKLR